MERCAGSCETGRRIATRATGLRLACGSPCPPETAPGPRQEGTRARLEAPCPARLIASTCIWGVARIGKDRSESARARSQWRHPHEADAPELGRRSTKTDRRQRTEARRVESARPRTTSSRTRSARAACIPGTPAARPSAPGDRAWKRSSSLPGKKEMARPREESRRPLSRSRTQS